MYLAALVAALVLGLTAAQVAPLLSTAVRREREAELAFRLGEYRRAITTYRAANSRYPARLEDLIVDPNALVRRKHLRRLYADPMTGAGDWDLEAVRDGAGRIVGIKDVHSRSDGSPLRQLDGKTSYRDW